MYLLANQFATQLRVALFCAFFECGRLKMPFFKHLCSRILQSIRWRKMAQKSNACPSILWRTWSSWLHHWLLVRSIPHIFGWAIFAPTALKIENGSHHYGIHRKKATTTTERKNTCQTDTSEMFPNPICSPLYCRRLQCRFSPKIKTTNAYSDIYGWLIAMARQCSAVLSSICVRFVCRGGRPTLRSPPKWQMCTGF